MSNEDLMVGEHKVEKVDKDTLVELLNGDLSREYQAIITYIQYSASVTGPYRQELKNFFAGEIPDETRHAQYLADKISALGGVPTVVPEAVSQETNAKKMLENIAEAPKPRKPRATIIRFVPSRPTKSERSAWPTVWTTWPTTNRATWMKPSKFCKAGTIERRRVGTLDFAVCPINPTP